jgi:hypothetical protein
VQYPSEATIASSIYPANRKRFLNVEMKASEIWEIPAIETDTEQVSEILTADYIEREGDFYAEFLRDVNTPNVTYPLIEGDFLVGNVIYLTVRNNSTEKALFTGVTPVAIPSERSQR